MDHGRKPGQILSSLDRELVYKTNPSQTDTKIVSSDDGVIDCQQCSVDKTASVTLDEACNGLLNAIKYLQCHPEYDVDMIFTLQGILQCIHSRLVSAHSCTAPVELLLKEPTKCEPSQSDTSDIVPEDAYVDNSECTCRSTHGTNITNLNLGNSNQAPNIETKTEPVAENVSSATGNFLEGQIYSAPGDKVCAMCEMSFKEHQDLLDHYPVHLLDLAQNENSSQKITKNNFDSEDIEYNEDYKDDTCVEDNQGSEKTSEEAAFYPERTLYSCVFCSKSSHRFHTLTSHQKKCHPESGCILCGKEFPSQLEKDKHIKLHAVKKKRNVQCLQCQNRFTSKEGLTKHEQRHNKKCMPRKKNNNGNFMCQVCGRIFSQAGALTIHERDHSGVKPYSCSVCNKPFKSKSALNRHVHVHTDEKPHMCMICGNQFALNSHLTIHMRTHTGERPYTCEVCNKTFAKRTGYTMHMKIHAGEKNHKCEICEKAFICRRKLRRHMRVHTGEKPYSCDMCSKAFKNPHSLLGHKRLHSGEKPFSCEVCGMRFADKSNLQKHARRIHCTERTAVTAGKIVPV